MLRSRNIIIIISLVIILLAAGSWHFLVKKSATPPCPPPPISVQDIDVTASIELDTDVVTSDNVIEISYRWETGPSWTPLPDSVLIFLHLKDEDGMKICQGDHTPPVPLQDWEADHTYEYKRLLYIPITLLKKNAFLVVGFYDRRDASKHFALKGLPKHTDNYRYLAKEFVLFPSRQEFSETLAKYKTGWYGPELDKDGNLVHRWMSGHGECDLVNPKADSYLYLDLWVPNEHLTKPATISVALNNVLLQVPEYKDNSLRAMFEIPATQLGTADFVSLIIETDETFVPVSQGIGNDTRELGIAARKIILRGQKTNVLLY